MQFLVSPVQRLILPPGSKFGRIQFHINHYCSSEEYANFIDRQGATNYKVQGKKDLKQEWLLAFQNKTQTR